MGKLADYFKPEFLNRFDDIVEFNPLSKSDLKSILNLMLTDVNHMLSSQGFKISVSSAAKDKLVDLGYNPAMGARPLRRVIQEQIEDKVADYCLDHPESKTISVDVNDKNEIYVTPEN